MATGIKLAEYNLPQLKVNMTADDSADADVKFGTNFTTRDGMINIHNSIYITADKTNANANNAALYTLIDGKGHWLQCRITMMQNLVVDSDSLDNSAKIRHEIWITPNRDVNAFAGAKECLPAYLSSILTGATPYVVRGMDMKTVKLTVPAGQFLVVRTKWDCSGTGNLHGPASSGQIISVKTMAGGREVKSNGID